MSKHYFSPAEFFKFKFLPLVKDYRGEYYPILSDRYVLSVWVGVLAKKFRKTRHEILCYLLWKQYLCLMVIDRNVYNGCTFCYNIGLSPPTLGERVCVHVCV